MATTNFYKEILTKAQGIIDAVNAISTGGGVSGTPASPVTGTVASGIFTTISAQNTNRLRATLTNRSLTNTLKVTLVDDATQTNSMFILQPEQVLTLSPASNEAYVTSKISVIATSGTVEYTFAEVTS